MTSWPAITDKWVSNNNDVIYAFFSETPAALLSCSRSLSGYCSLLALCTLIRWSQICISGPFNAVVPRRLQRCRELAMGGQQGHSPGVVALTWRGRERERKPRCRGVWSTHSTDVGRSRLSECACEQGYHLLLWHLQTRCRNCTMRARSEHLTGPLLILYPVQPFRIG